MVLSLRITTQKKVKRDTSRGICNNGIINSGHVPRQEIETTPVNSEPRVYIL